MMKYTIPVLIVLTTGCSGTKDILYAPPGMYDSGYGGGSGGMPDDGCIRINGSGGFSTIGSALDWAEDGDVISLCAEEYNERVIITKAVTLKGPASGEPAVINGPSDDSTISVRSDNVDLSWLTINGPGNGVYIQDVDSITLKVLSFGSTGNTAIRASGSTNVLIQASNFSDLEHGVVHIDEAGSMRVVNCSFDGIAGYATRVRTEATLSLEGNDFYDNVADSDGRNAAARATDNAFLFSSGNVFSGNSGESISANNSRVQSTGDSFNGGTHAISSYGGPVIVDQATITHPTVTGIKARATDGDVSITNSTLTADPISNALAGAESWELSLADEGVGVYASGETTVTIANVILSGFNHGGVHIIRGGEDDVIANLTNVDMTNIGWHGVYGNRTDSTLTDVSVTGLRVSDAVGPDLCTKVGEYGGATFLSSTVDWQGGGVTNGGGMGMAGIESTMNFSGATIGNNSCAGIMNFQGSVTIDDSDFSDPSPHPLGASVVSFNSTDSLLTNSRFVGSGEIFAETTEDGDYTYVAYARMGSDFQAWNGGTHTIDGNTFTTGSNGVYGNDADLTVTNNSWSDYTQYGALIVDGSLTYSDNTFTEGSGHLLACIRGTVSGGNSEVSATTSGTDRSTEAYLDGTLISAFPAPYAYPALYSEACDTELDSINFTDLVALAAQIKGGTHTFTNMSVVRPNSGGYYSNSAIEFDDQWTRTTDLEVEDFVGETHATLTDVSISETGWGGGVLHTGSRDGGTAVLSSLVLNNVTMSDLGSNGLEAQDVDVTLENTTINTTSGSAIVVTDGSLSASGGGVDQASRYGLMLTETVAVIEGMTVQNSLLDGIYASGSSLTATASTVKLNQGSGLRLSGVTANLVGNNITDNAEYGMICGGSTFIACDNAFLGNVLGTTDSCDSDCFDDIVVEDTGHTDTGAPDPTDTGSTDTGGVDTAGPPTPEDTGSTETSDTGTALLGDATGA